MALWENVIGYGPHADRPAAGSPGAVYFESDTGNGYRDSGTGWDLIVQTPSAAVARTVYMPTENLVLTVANAYVVCGAEDLQIELPPAATSSGLSVLVDGGGHTMSVRLPGGADEADHGYISPGEWISDGTTWRAAYGIWS